MRETSGCELADLFDEIWQVAELVAVSEDQHLVPWLLELADTVLTWFNQQNRDAMNRPAAAAVSLRPSLAPACNDALSDECSHRLRNMTVLIARQHAVVSDLARAGNTSYLACARELLSAMEASLELTRSAAVNLARDGWHFAGG